jgi:hypothetical protein
MKIIRYCLDCGKRMTESQQKFCHGCGGPLCKQCGYNPHTAERRCVHCRARLPYDHFAPNADELRGEPF